MAKAYRFVSKYPSQGFQGRWWDRAGIETVVTAEELAEEKKLGYGSKNPKDDKSALKHFKPLDAEEHGELTMNEAAKLAPETAPRVMGLPDPDHPEETLPVPTSGDVTIDPAPGSKVPGLADRDPKDTKPQAVKSKSK